MKPGYLVSFPTAEIVGIDRIRDFAEGVWDDLHAAGLGDVPNELSATRDVRVEVSASRHLGRALRIVKLRLRRHNLDDDAVVSRLT